MAVVADAAWEAGEAQARRNEELSEWQAQFQAGADKIQGLLEKEKDSINEETEATKKLLQAQADLDKARVKEAEAVGSIGPIEAARREEEIDNRLARALADNEQNAKAREIASRESAQTRYYGIRDKALGQIDESAAGLDKTESSQAKLKRFIGQLEQSAGGATEAEQIDKTRKLTEAVEKIKAEPRHTESGRMTPFQVARLTTAESELSGQEQSRRLLTEARERMAALNSEHEKFSKGLERHKTEASEAEKALERLDTEIGKLKSHGANETEVRNREEARRRVESDTKALKSPTGKLLADVSEAEYGMAHGHKPSLIQQSEILGAMELLKLAHIAQGEAVIKGLGSLHGNVDALTRRIAAIVGTIEKQGHQIRNTSNDGT